MEPALDPAAQAESAFRRQLRRPAGRRPLYLDVSSGPGGQLPVLAHLRAIRVAPMLKKLQIENCKLKIANWARCRIGSFGQSLSKAVATLRVTNLRPRSQNQLSTAPPATRSVSTRVPTQSVGTRSN